MMSRRAKLYCTFILLTALVASAFFMGLWHFISTASEPLPMGPRQKLDAIVVLTGGSNRLDAGFDLLEQGAGKKLFISGVYRGLEVQQLLKLWKDEPQSSLDCCVALGFATDTAGNAVETAEWMRKEEYKSLYLVTANYHIKRAMLHFNEIAPELTIVPFPIVPDKVSMKGWWQDPTIRNLVVREYVKYIATYAWHFFKRFS